MFHNYYFEIHITIAPVFEERLQQLKTITEHTRFKVASLLMKKREQDTPTLSQYDTFMTAHTMSKEEAVVEIQNIIAVLKGNNYEVLRYKIEDVIMDSRNKDVLGLL